MSYYNKPDNIYNEMILNVTNTDTSENSYVYNALYPNAMQLSYCLLLMDQVENKVFASKAVENGYSDYLELRCSEIGIVRKQATYATPNVTFTGKVGTQVPQGFIVSTNDNRLYTTNMTTIIGSDGTVTIQVMAEKVGSAYNIKAGDINYIPSKYSGIVSVINKDSYIDAYDKETDIDLYNRYLTKVRKNAISSNKAYIQEQATSVTGVGKADVYPLCDENLNFKEGHVVVMVIDSNGEPASVDLLQKVKYYLSPDDEGLGEGVCDIGMKIHVIAPTSFKIDVTANILVDTSITTIDIIKSTFTTNLTSYLKNTVFKTRKLVYSKIEGLLIGINGCEDISNLKVNGDINNITLTNLQLAEAGNITLNNI